MSSGEPSEDKMAEPASTAAEAAGTVAIGAADLANLHVYGELSILGYNGHIPNAERNGRRNKSKFLLCRRPTPNGIKKSRHYIVKQPQATKAIQDKDLHSISYTFSRSQTIIVEYKLDEGIDMFQIGRSSEEPIDFVVMDTAAPPPEPTHPNPTPANQSSSSSAAAAGVGSVARAQPMDGVVAGSSRGYQHHYPLQSENIPGMSAAAVMGASSMTSHLVASAAAAAPFAAHFHAAGHHLAKGLDEPQFLNCRPPLAHDPRNQHLHHQFNPPHRQHAQAMLLNYQPTGPGLGDLLSPLMADQSRYQQLIFERHQNGTTSQQQHQHHHHHHHLLHQQQQQQQQQQLHQPHHLPTPSHIQRPHQHIQPQQPPHLMHTVQPSVNNHYHQPHHHHHHHSHHLHAHPHSHPHHLPHTNTHAAHQNHQQSSSINRPPICDNNLASQSQHPAAVAAAADRTQHGSSKRSHATQSTISRFACRILIDRKPPYHARIYAAGFDSSKNIFLGEKATKWEQNNSIDGLTTNGVLLMHPKKGHFNEQSATTDTTTTSNQEASNDKSSDTMENDQQSDGNQHNNNNKEKLSSEHGGDQNGNGGCRSESPSPTDMSNNDESRNKNEQSMEELGDSMCDNQDNIEDTREKTCDDNHQQLHSKNNNIAAKDSNSDTGGVWREVSVDGGIYAIRDSRSAPQKGIRIQNEDNVLQDGTLIDLCGATLLWRSVEGFRASPTKKTLEDKIDMLNATRPQCPVNLNTLVIPRKPIHGQHASKSHHHHHHHKDNNHHGGKEKDKSHHQPYVYLKCGHVQGYHSWGAIDKSNHRTCPICLSVGSVAKLSMGLEPSFYVDSGPLSHVFNPCGHMASERTVKYWTSVKIPHGTHFFHSICPFCATPLTTDEPASTKLIFQDHLD